MKKFIVTAERKMCRLTPEETTTSVCYRVQAVKDFTLKNGKEIKAGDFGGYVEKEANLSQIGDCWLYDDTFIVGNALLRDDAIMCDHARAGGEAVISGEAHISGYAVIAGGEAVIADTVRIGGVVRIYGVRVHGKIEIVGNGCITR